MGSQHDTDQEFDGLENKVVGVFDDQEGADNAGNQLTAAGFGYELLRGEEGHDKLDPGSEGGLWGALKSFAATFGDESQIVGQLLSALDAGKVVVAVDIAEGDSKSAVEILDDAGGQHLWEFDTWTHTRVASEPESGESTEVETNDN